VVAPAELMMKRRDSDVETRSAALRGKRVLVGITGGIAAVDSVRLLRELRRHGADLTVMMTHSAQRVISPLAVEWACQTPVLTDWSPEMSQLDRFDGILVSPATRQTIAAHVHGIMDTPLQMALSAGRGGKTPILFVPSMHGSLFDDPVTDDLCQSLEQHGHHVLWGPKEEGRLKQPDPVRIVAELCHVINSERADRKRTVVTLGANRSAVDAVRWIQNTSSGKTGWSIAEHLYRMGHKVTVIAGDYSHQPTFPLPDVHHEETPDGMLEVLIELANGPQTPDSWVHCAAVLDYCVAEPSVEKVKSGSEEWTVQLSRTAKHLDELTPLCEGATRIAFKLESGVSDDQLVERARSLIESNGLAGVMANHLEEVNSGGRRAIWVPSSGESVDISDSDSLNETVEQAICG
jgi:phosphopantothenoylcysteine decarboxylase/phosphopantothenate--cysteine ligase